ncbi:hypothetical protein B0A49_10242 [Cryomyces minteri]|uniref:Enoyl reductase (ER) domain-containing protein n=1 Tax=Cryomyces minteri TaxID=331657 RepID=A0A4U0WU81_9PEZI|nr:hypothetical protein B0A49_10242 [Cryomyces minteri]
MALFCPDRTNPALYTTKDHRIYAKESPELHVDPDDCVVHVRANGIFVPSPKHDHQMQMGLMSLPFSSSDLHFWKHGSIGECVVEDDYVLGHEGAGTIVSVGSNVSGLSKGDRVAIEPGVPCGTCALCEDGRYNLCRDVRFSGAPPFHGSIRRYHVHAAKFLHKLPANLTFTDGALLEPLSVVLHAFNRSPSRIGDPVLICGAGPIGLIALAVARATCAYPIVITDVDEKRLEFAKSFVPQCEVFHISTSTAVEAVAEEIKRVFTDKLGTQQPQIVYECTGVQSSINTAAYSAARGGQVMVVGVGRPILDGFPFMHCSMSEIDIKFINRYHHTWPSAIRLLSAGYIDLKPLVTKTFKLEEAVSALESAAGRVDATVKIHIVDDPL